MTSLDRFDILKNKDEVFTFNNCEGSAEPNARKDGKIMKRYTQWILLIVFTSAIFLGACTLMNPSLDGSSWILRSYRDDQGNTVDVLRGSTTTALFQADQITGSAGCNNYNTSFQTTRNRLTFGQVATTRKMCNSPMGIMLQEKTFLNALNSTASYKLSLNSLEMIDRAGRTLLVFRRSIE